MKIRIFSTYIGGTMALVNIWVTNFCNLNCSYCYEKEKKETYLKEELLTPIIDFIKKIEDDNALAINFHGGEPLLNFEVIKKIVAQSKLENIFADFSLTTNLLLMNNEIADYVSSNHIYLSISLDGTEHVNDINRIDKNNRGTYKKVIKKLNILKKYNIPFRTRMTVTPFTINYLYESVTHLINIGCKEIVAAPDLFCQHWDEEKISQLSLQLDLIYDFLNKIKDANFSFYSEKIKKIGTCYGGIKEFNIDCNGNIYPCTFTVGDKSFVIGNILEGIDKSRLEKFKKYYYKENQACEGCFYQNYCLSSRCKYLNKLLEGDFCKSSSIICAMENVMYKKLTCQ